MTDISQTQQSSSSLPSPSVPISMNCGKCLHLREIPGDCHVSCINLNANPKRRTRPGSIWPWNFDRYTILECDGYVEKPNSLSI